MLLKLAYNENGIKKSQMANAVIQTILSQPNERVLFYVCETVDHIASRRTAEHPKFNLKVQN